MCTGCGHVVVIIQFQNYIAIPFVVLLISPPPSLPLQKSVVKVSGTVSNTVWKVIFLGQNFRGLKFFYPHENYPLYGMLGWST